MRMTSEARVYVVDDDPDMRDGLRWLIEGVGLAMECFADGSAFLANYDANLAGCLITDVRMPGLSGLALQDEMAARSIELPVIVITGHGDVPTAVRALQAGAIDFLEKPFSEQQLLDRLQQALELDARRLREQKQREALTARRSLLTDRETEVLALVSEGLKSRAIAEYLGISVRTVDVHRARMMQKMGAPSLAALLKMLQGSRAEPDA